MVVKSFNQTVIYPGTLKVWNGSSWIPQASSPITIGMYGTNDTISHPHPFTSPGPWTLVRNVTDHGYGIGWFTNAGAWYDLGSRSFAAPNGTSDPIVVTSTTLSDLLARSNPSKPSVDLPVFIGELGDITNLLRVSGNTTARKVASGNLGYQFGWKPLLGDLKILLDFQAEVDRVSRKLTRLYDRGGLKFSEMLGKSYKKWPEVYAGRATYGVDVWYTQIQSWERWAQVQWVPQIRTGDAIPPLSQIRLAAFRAAIGGTVDLSTLWELLPWSWLIDWFADVGSWLAAQRNVVGFVPGNCCTMTHIKAETLHRCKAQPGSTGTIVPPYYLKETKMRVMGVPVLPTAHIPFADARKLGILASLAVLRLR